MRVFVMQGRAKMILKVEDENLIVAVDKAHVGFL
jgi:hypothetical protein